MSNQPRHHHYIPQFYLAGFTKAGSKGDSLHVFDKTSLKSWKSTPKGSGHKRDFHAIAPEVTGDAMEVEKKLASLEGQWSTVLRSTIESGQLPDGESFADLMMFVAFMAVRVVRIRNVLSDAINRISKAMIETMLATEQGRRNFRKTIEASGRAQTDEEIDELVEFAAEGQYDIDFEQTWHVTEMLQMGVALGPLLSLRNWKLWPVKNDAPDLICSDNPVAPTWLAPPDVPLLSPAFGLPNTIVTVPLNRRIAIAGVLDEELPDWILDRDAVAALNSATGMYANQIFSSEPDFVWATKDDAVGDTAPLRDQLEQQRGKSD